jgi:hypothetical protein
VDSTREAVPSIWLIHPDGRGERALVSVDSLSSARRVERAWITGALVWSPDGGKLAFALGEAIWTINGDGSGLRRVKVVR